jgi:hypothetical protein
LQRSIRAAKAETIRILLGQRDRGQRSGLLQCRRHLSHRAFACTIKVESTGAPVYVHSVIKSRQAES